MLLLLVWNIVHSGHKTINSQSLQYFSSAICHLWEMISLGCFSDAGPELSGHTTRFAIESVLGTSTWYHTYLPCMILVPCYRIQLFMSALGISAIYTISYLVYHHKKKENGQQLPLTCAATSTAQPITQPKKKRMSYIHLTPPYNILALMTRYTHAHRTISLTVRAGLQQRPSLPPLHRLFHMRPASPSSSSLPT